MCVVRNREAVAARSCGRQPAVSVLKKKKSAKRRQQILRGFAFYLSALLIAVTLGCGGPDSAPASGNAAKSKNPSENRRPVQSPAKKIPPVPDIITLPSESPQETNPSDPEASPLVGSFQPDDADPPAAKTQRYRPSDSRPKHDAKALEELGVKRYASKHLELFTDIEPARAQDLPKLADQLYAELERYFGPLPPDREESAFQMTGYIMADQRVFRETGLIPENLPGFNHGRHRGAEFWMNDQEFDYYLRHLMLHEATHCYMTFTKKKFTLPPVWYMEGMAELFGTHAIDKTGKAAFRVMPHDKEAFAGLGRITLVQTAVKENRFRPLESVFNMAANEYSDDEAYAWSWAMCKFLDTHPRYQKRFRELGKAATFREFARLFEESFPSDLADMRTEWALFAHQLDEGYQIEPAAIVFKEGEPLTTGGKTQATIKADRGWQSSGVLIEQGKKYRITASGRFTLAQKPKPWISESDGISFRYFAGQPLGRLLGCLRTGTPDSETTASSMRQVFPIGADHTFIAPQTGTLYLRLNDSWSEIADNTGEVQVSIALE